ncbi:hypothetical protein PQR67_34530 [Paraburkholderia fungorum]|uniref:hypothetical protein n=1 Tax=Paraburkholderia fungorum TaxID=134537 RepID=UPI0038BE0F5F
MTRLRNACSSVAIVWSAAVLITAAFSQSTLAQETRAYASQTALGKAEVVHAQVHVVAIHPATNSVTLRGPYGHLADVDVNPQLADVRKLRVGDKLNVAYQQALLLHVDKVTTPGVRERVETTVAIPASAGYASSAHRVQIVATVLKINRKSRMVTLRGPKHQQVLRAAASIPLNELKVGDSVRAEFVSAAAVEVVRE